MQQILVLNLGSTSFKFKLFDMKDDERCIAIGGVENIGAKARISVKFGEQKARDTCTCETHMDAMTQCMGVLSKLGLSIDIGTLCAVGYKAVHGGRISGSQVVDDTLLDEMERMVDFAPAHNPVYLTMMRQMRETYPNLVQIACFETSFHATIPMERVVYGVPYDWIEEYGVRRYGFHGSSHSYIAHRMKELAPHAQRIISIHLGGSSSLCAIKAGKSVATSMGATPQSGLFQNNRVGDFDAFCLPSLIKALGGQEEVYGQLSFKSGLLGLSGVSNDMRLIKQAAKEGNKRAQLALAAYADNIVGYIGMFTAYLGGLDAICFTGGIGFNDAELRYTVTHKLTFVQAKLDEGKNFAGYEGKISAVDSGVEIWLLETNEELMVARVCLDALDK